MDWLLELFKGSTGPAAQAALVLSLIATLGLLLGRIRLFGVTLGITGVLFAGLAFGHFQYKVSHEVLDFVREFGLILFVYTIGIQVGPGFFASLRQQGLPLAIISTSIVLLGVVVTVLVALLAGEPVPAAAGLFSGATTNTPSLGATGQALKDVLDSHPDLPADELVKLPALAYAVAYPFGILGLIITMLLIKKIFRIDVQAEGAALAAAHAAQTPPLSTINLEVTNPNLNGLAINRLPVLRESGVVISRLSHQGRTVVARGDSLVHLGDVLLVVGPAEKLDEFRLVVGKESQTDLRKVFSQIVADRLIVTKPDKLGKSIQELDVSARYGVTVTRVARADIEFAPTPELRLQFGDTLMIVGQNEDIERAAREFGNSPKELNHPMLVPLFVGIALGVICGSYPIFFPGVPSPVKLGLAGGPLVVAILLSRLSRVGPVVWYMPIAANFMLREVGIVLFLSCVGLRAGDQFVATLTQGHGLYWLLYGALITILPVLVVGIAARLILKLNYVSLLGVLAGSMTDPPALAFANTLAGSDAPAVSYATVYPLTMLLRVLSAQLLVLLLMS